MVTAILANWAASLVSKLIYWLPIKLRLRVAGRLADRQLAFDQQHADTTISNLRCVYNKLSRPEATRLAIRSAHLQARAKIDHLWVWHASVRALTARAPIDGAVDFERGKPVIIVAVHQPGMEVAAMRLSMLAAGGVVVDAGHAIVPGAARRAWRRFGDQEIIPSDKAAAGAVRVLRSGRHVLVFIDEPAGGDGRSVMSVPVAGAVVRVSRLVPVLANRFNAEIRWMSVTMKEGEDLGHDDYRVSLRKVWPADEMISEDKWAKIAADGLMNVWAQNPAGYWWGRKRLSATGVERARQSEVITRQIGLA